MKYLRYWLPLFFCLFVSQILHGLEEQEFPVLYKGRFRPVEAYAPLWLYERYHSPTLKKNDLAAFKTTTQSPLSLIWSLEFLGHLPYEAAPLFWIRSADLKNTLALTPTRDRFSYQELQEILNSKKKIDIQDKTLNEEWSSLLASLKEFERLEGMHLPLEDGLQERWAELQKKGLPPKEIGRLLEQEYPLMQRLERAGSLFKSLPSRYKEGEWFALKALKVRLYHPASQELKEVGNFTLFSDEHFHAIRQAYALLEKAFLHFNHDNIESAKNHLTQILAQAYAPLAGKMIQQAHEKHLNYPSFNQLKAETVYVHYPWIPLLIAIYSVGAAILLISYRNQWPFGHLLAMCIIIAAILCHTALLLIRSFILERPPVSNMFETVIYVPWVAACATLLLPSFRKHSLAIIAACITSIGLLIILEVTDLNQNLDQVQAVLDSQFWLLIHVLMVVGSYGIFILGAILGHFYLGMFIVQKQETASMKQLSWMILQTMYGGTVLLVTGTILGGIWAAESWGRFWDWDPKESWAFISSCFYLIWIHAYRFHRIASFGLAVGAVGGLLIISFTWYGVNYILGTGLHSYGFGSGGELYYYAFLIGECLFLVIACWAYFHKHRIKANRK